MDLPRVQDHTGESSYGTTAFGGKTVKCALCCKIVKTLSALKNHLYSVHYSDDFKKSLKTKTNCSLQQESENGRNRLKVKKVIQCAFCPAVLKSVSDLKNHFLGKHGKTTVKTRIENEKMFPNVDKSEYECKICLDKFDNSLLYETHVSIHAGFLEQEEKLFQCNICGEAFQFPGELVDHSSTHFTNTGELIEHSTTHWKNTGEFIERSTTHSKNTGELIEHSTTHFKKTGEMVEHSTTNFKQIGELVEHSATHFKKTGELVEHSSTYFRNTVSTVVNSLQSNPVGNIRLHACKECNIAFKFKTKLENHMKHVHKHLKLAENPKEVQIASDFHQNVNATSDETKSISPESVLNSNSPETFKIEECIGNATSNGLRPIYQCNHCYQTRKSAWSLKNHYYRKHCKDGRKIKKFKLLQNKIKMALDIKKEKEIIKTTNSSREKSQTETSNKEDSTTFNCKDCPRTYRTRISLLKHERVHSNEPPLLFKCWKCSKPFSWPSSLHRHYRTMHGDERSRYKCEDCGKRFSRNTYLLQHMRLHDVNSCLVCAQCGRRFAWETALIRHVKYFHSPVTPVKHECYKCGKYFSRKDNLRTHIKHHGRIERYKCRLCGKLFKRANRFEDHLNDKGLHLGIRRRKERLKKEKRRMDKQKLRYGHYYKK